MENKAIIQSVKAMNNMKKMIKRYEALEVIDTYTTNKMLNEIGKVKNRIFQAYPDIKSKL